MNPLKTLPILFFFVVPKISVNMGRRVSPGGNPFVFYVTFTQDA